jgi:hypothetical protein
MGEVIDRLVREFEVNGHLFGAPNVRFVVNRLLYIVLHWEPLTTKYNKITRNAKYLLTYE